MKKVLKKFLLLVLVPIIITIIFLNEDSARVVYLFCAVAFGAWFLKQWLSVTGGPEVLDCVGLTIGPIFFGTLANWEPAQKLSAKIGPMIQCFLDKIGISLSHEIGAETIVIIIFFVFFFIFEHRPGVMKAQKGPADAELTQKDYYDKRQVFCHFLIERLQSINSELSWIDSHFTPIEAEVEVRIRGKRKKRFSDMLKCLKSVRHKGAIFLVLGDPGSGKSVALRKLCMELLGEAAHAKRIPAYIDLKKWNENWNMNHLPNRESLINFIKGRLNDGGDENTKSFLDVYFDKMLENGQWYFVFDSFDEMPCLMGRQNCQELINRISELLCQFMTGVNQNGGIIASRLYKSPSEALNATVTLKIQRFNDIKIKKTLKNHLDSTYEVIPKLFGEREDLVALCRNPFHLTLLADYLKNSCISFPQNQMELFSSFVEKRLHDCGEKIAEDQLTVEAVHEGAKELAVFMQKSVEYGLECPLIALNGHGTTKDWRKVLELLAYTKICRFGGENEAVSFVHRRFQEFFLVESIIEQGQGIERKTYEGIINGSGMRDALVLYCEVAEEEKAQEIAHFCWDTIQSCIGQSKSVWNEGGVELVSALHFMAEAFRGRQSAIKEFQDEFEQLVEEHLNGSTDFVIQMALVDSMVLFRQAQLQNLVQRVFELKNHWLSDVVVENCRVIKQLNSNVEFRFIDYILQMNIRTFWERFWNMRFSLSISKSFQRIRRFHLTVAVFELTLLGTTIASAVVAGIVGVQQILGGEAVRGELNIWMPSGFLSAVCGMSIGILLAEYVIYFTETRFRRFAYIEDEDEDETSVHSALFLKMSRRGNDEYYKPQMSGVHKLCIWLGPPSVLILLTCEYPCSGLVWLIRELMAGLSLLMLFVLAIPWMRNMLKDTEWKVIRNQLIEFITDYTNRIFIVGFIVIVAVTGLIGYFLVKLLYPWKEVILWITVCLSTISLGGFLIARGGLFLIHKFKDERWIRRQPSVRNIPRKKLAKDLEELHYAKSKWRYVEQLQQRGVKLTGQWEDNERPKFEYDELNYSLAKLDSAQLNSCNYLF